MNNIFIIGNNCNDFYHHALQFCILIVITIIVVSIICLFDDWLLFIKMYNSVHVTDFSFNSSDLFSLKVSIIRFVIERPWELTMNCTAERE